MIEVYRTPNPYTILRLKLIDEASLKYLVGQVISAISKFASNIKSSELVEKLIALRSSLEKALYPVWYSEIF